MVNNKLDCKTEKFNCLGLKEPYQDSKGETKAKTEKLALKTKIKTLGRKNETNTMQDIKNTVSRHHITAGK